MSHLKGLLDLKDAKKEKIVNLFQLAKSLQDHGSYHPSIRGSVLLLFLEPSTRTRISFEVASYREGLMTVVVQGKAATSMEKEETLEDTFLNVGAMDPAAIVVRAGDDYQLDQISVPFDIPVINAGWGVKGHPTQALLDAFTLYKKWGDLAGRKILIIGDVIHSRVAQSHFELSRIMGYDVRVFSPPALLPSDPSVKNFTDISEGLRWSDAVMALRTQKERHGSQFAVENFNHEWGLNSDNIKNLKPEAFVMHPGPVHWGTEISLELKPHPQSIILDQVRSGVFVRQALLRMIREAAW